MTRPVRPGPPRAGDPYGIGIVGSYLAPALAIVGLLIVSIATLNVINGGTPFGVRSPGGADGPDGPGPTPAPSNVVIVEPDAVFPGSILYVKAGNVWIQTEDVPRQLTSGGKDSMPSWSPDGEWIYFIRTSRSEGEWFARGQLREYVMDVPSLMRVRADGSANAERLKSGRFKRGGRTWFYWIRQPVLSPDGTTIALVSDAPNPDDRDVVLQFYNLETGRFRVADAPQTQPLGHQDPAWRPDGLYLLYTKNGREGSRGAPVIARYDPKSKKVRNISPPGYLQPDYSPDGRYIAATRTRSFGTDVVILDAARGTEVMRVTTDGSSWAPVWSPAGDAIAFLHLENQIVDLRMAAIAGTGPDFTLGETINLTTVSGLDAASRPDWFVPSDELPATPPPTDPPATSAAPASTAP
jgi:Tol biopolymer transport system component